MTFRRDLLKYPYPSVLAAIDLLLHHLSIMSGQQKEYVRFNDVQL